MAIALFLGAGFSKPWGMPISNEVMKLDDLKKKALPGRWQRELIEKVEACWVAHHTQYENVVDRFAQALHSSPLDELTFEEFARFIAFRFSAHHWKVGTARETKWATGDHIQKQRKIPEGYNTFIKALNGQTLTGIITTNYDLVIEKLLGPSASGRLGGFNYGKEGEPVEGKHPHSSKWSYGPIQLTGRIPLLKLHGSLNWALSNHGGITKYVDSRPSRGRRYKAVLLPPGLSHAPILSGFRDRAEDVLSASNIWVFCGYSMPDYDEDVVGLLRSSAVGQLGRVVILDPDPLPIARKLESKIGLYNGEPEVRINYSTGPGLSPSLTSKELTSLIGLDDNAL